MAIDTIRRVILGLVALICLQDAPADPSAPRKIKLPNGQEQDLPAGPPPTPSEEKPPLPEPPKITRPQDMYFPKDLPPYMKDRIISKFRESKPGKGPEPLIFASFELAAANAARRGMPILAALQHPGDSTVPPLFRDPSIARASRMTVSLVVLEYLSEDEFFKSRRLSFDVMPRYAFFDPNGNLFETIPVTVEPSVMAAAIRNAKASIQRFAETLPEILARAESIADESALLELARPFLAKHYRGYPELSRLSELVAARGEPRLAAAKDIESLEAVARDFAHTPIEAAAFLEMARIHRTSGREAEAKSLCVKIVNELPWPENAEVHRQARVILDEFRRAEIKRRLEEIERKKRLEAELKQIHEAVRYGRVICPR